MNKEHVEILSISWIGNNLNLPRVPELMGVSMVYTFHPPLPVCSTASMGWPLLQDSVSRNPLSDKKSFADSEETGFIPTSDFTVPMLLVNISVTGDAFLEIRFHKGSQKTA